LSLQRLYVGTQLAQDFEILFLFALEVQSDLRVCAAQSKLIV
jgi:hypothetical protein